MSPAHDATLLSQIATDTIGICTLGHYTTTSDQQVSLHPTLAQTIASTVEYEPGQEVHRPERNLYTTTFETNLESTLDAAFRLSRDPTRRVAALNFASARNPGGGFQRGTMAQEESIAYRSGLYPTLLGKRMYDMHRDHDARSRPGFHLYQGFVIVSPDVPVFRGEGFELLEEPWTCSFLTSPAPNTRAHLEHATDQKAAEREAMAVLADRFDRVLTIAARHHFDTLVLGAWGCGIFGANPERVAQIMKDAFDGPFRGVFRHVAFAILERSYSAANVQPFALRFVRTE